MLVVLALGLIYNAVILLEYGPDEGRHVNYVKLLLNEGALPYLEPDPARSHARTRLCPLVAPAAVLCCSSTILCFAARVARRK
jgi:hypothetical protein